MIYSKLITIILGLFCFYGFHISNAALAKPKIVIIGAGPSGLSCGVKLKQYGYDDLTILEAESRIGGRINTVPFADSFIDIGAQWCHGEKDNVVYELVKNLDLLANPNPAEKNMSFVRSDGELVNLNLSDRVVKMVVEIIDGWGANFENTTDSLGKYIKDKFDKKLRLTENADIDKSLAEEFFTCFDKARSSFEGSDTLFDVSAEAQLDYWNCEGELNLNWKGEGFGQFLRVLLKSNEINKEYGVLDGHIKTAKTVELIELKPTDNKVLVKTEDGEEILADHVIVTVSLGVLKNDYEKMFKPALSAKKQNAIDGIAFGMIAKVFLEFEEKFWPDDWVGFSMLWREEDLKKLIGTENEWLTGFYGFYAVNYQPRVLGGWIVGENARAMEKMSKTRIETGCLYILNNFLPFNISKPINMLYSKWFSNPNFRGTYSYHSLRTQETGATTEDLAEPIFLEVEGKAENKKPAIQFAGEATHKHYYSTVHGAVETGFREAKRLLDYYKEQKKYSLLTKLLILLLTVVILTAANEMFSPKIVIIGAGPSGIACATKLLEKGFKDITLLEAEPRIGGRIHTVPFADNVVDLGGQWCHGQKNNVVYEMVKDLNLLESSGGTHDYYSLARSNGELIKESIAERLIDILNKISRERYNETITFEGTAQSFLKTRFEENLAKTENQDIDRKLAEEAFKNFEKIQSSVEGSDSMNEISVNGDPEYEECEGDQTLNWKDKGYKELLRLLMKTNETNTELGVLEGHLKLSKEVEKIQWQREDTKVLLKCVDGEEILADHVIVTVSLGVLKAMHTKLFEPQLPAEKQRAIEGINFGTVNKIYIEFEENFLPDNFTGFAALWREEDLNEIRNTSRAWLEDFLGFFAVNYQPRIVCGWVIGANGRKMEKLTQEQIKADSLYAFRKFMPWKIPEPVNFLPTAWFTNPHFKGSYSYHSVDTENLGVTSEDLANPLYACGKECKKPIVQFAGEATNTNHYSTVHGAVETGWREAKRLNDFYNSK